MPRPLNRRPLPHPDPAARSLGRPGEEAPTRRRAPGMSPDQRRAMIVAAALPLVAEYGAAVTTSRIARAAGIGEATVFRVFKDKDEVLDACLAEVTDPDHVLRELASIPRDEPLPVRLAEAAAVIRAHLERMGTVLSALYASGHRRGRSAGDRPSPGGRATSAQAVHDAVTALIEPDRAALRLAPEKAAAILLGMLSPWRVPPPGDAEPTPGELIDVLLHGVLRDATLGPDPAGASAGDRDDPAGPSAGDHDDPAGPSAGDRGTDPADGSDDSRSTP